jgi:hypothetical protein
MPPGRHDHFLSANRELRNFLERVDAMVHGTGDVGPGELRAIGRLLETMAPEIGEASHTVSADAALQAQTQEYVKNLRAFLGALEKVRSIMLARRAQLKAAKGQTGGLHGWVHARPQTT